MEESILNEWEAFYRVVFGLRIDLSSFDVFEAFIPSRKIIVVAKDLTADSLFLACQHHFGAARYGKDFSSITSSRRAYANYMVEFDDEKTPIDATRQLRYVPLTVEERLVLELWHYRTHGTFYDPHFTHLCEGSRYPDKTYPGVFVDRERKELSVGFPLTF